jgi:hypothetical protein
VVVVVLCVRFDLVIWGINLRKDIDKIIFIIEEKMRREEKKSGNSTG